MEVEVVVVVYSTFFVVVVNGSIRIAPTMVLLVNLITTEQYLAVAVAVAAAVVAAASTPPRERSPIVVVCVCVFVRSCRAYLTFCDCCPSIINGVAPPCPPCPPRRHNGRTTSTCAHPLK